jgi:glycosyltransferase involved in cell wall biosynthesis
MKESFNLNRKICHLSSVHTWNDIRIFKKELVSLASHGFETHFIVPCDSDKHINQVSIHAIAIPKNRFQRILLTTHHIYKKALEIDADIYHIHDPELLPIGSKLIKRGKKVIFDSHEDVPADILDKEWIPFRFLRKIISYVYNLYEKSTTHEFSAVISVSNNITNKFNCHKLLTLRNLPLLSNFNISEISSANKTFEKPYKVIYAGGLTRVRNIKQLIQSTKHLPLDDIQIHIFGDFDDETYRRECESLDEWPNIYYHGFKESSEVYSFMKNCSLGLILFKNIPNHEYAIPNKSYEYMAAGIPLLISDIHFWKSHFEKNAFFVNPESPEEIAKRIREVFEKPEELSFLSIENSNLVKNELNWEAESKKLINLYLNLL